MRLRLATDATIRARELRRALTPQEARLWLALRALRSQGYHFRRQSPVNAFFADLVCFGRRLIVELDGGQHGDGPQADHDAMRDAILGRAGFRTLRFWNSDVNTTFEGVRETILPALAHPPRPALTRRPPSP